MLAIRKANERGYADHGWLQTSHTFSFSDYQDPRFMGFRSLRVMNEDWIAPGEGFGTHPHRDMEIVTYVLQGTLAHRDSLGTGSELRPGELQRITAGTGVTHSEYNHSKDEPVHLYQIWLYPERKGLSPSYEQKSVPPQPGWRLVASPEGQDGSLTIHQDARIYLTDLDAGKSATRTFEPGRHGWLQVLRGQVQLDGQVLQPGDGVAISEEPRLDLTGIEPAELMLFDLN